jgi:hypothetical protein
MDEARREEGVQVIIYNMVLVEVGVDLLHFPTIIFYQGNDKINTVRQAAKRHWRIGQSRTCKTIFYVYNGTYQVEQFLRMMAKRSHALLLEGRLDKSQLSRYGGNDQHSSLTKSVAECLVNVEDLSAKWAELAALEIPEGLEMLEEEEFKAVLQDVKMKLWNQTRALCGVEIVEDVSKQTDEDISALADLFIQQHETKVAEAYTGVSAGDQLDLFSFSFEKEEQPAPKNDRPSMPLFTGTSEESGYRIVDMTSAVQRIVVKRKKKKQPIIEGQLGWLFDEAQ